MARRTGPPPCGRPRGRSRSPPGASRGRPPPTPCPACADSSRLGEAFAVIPLVKRALPEARLAFEDPARDRGRRRSVAGRHAAAAPRARRGRRARRRADLASRPRCSPCAEASWPRTTASSTRRSPPTRPATPTQPTRRRSTSAAARTSSRRCSPPTSTGTLLLKRALERPNALAGGAVALASTAAAVEVFAWSERHADTPVSRALKRPGYELQRALGTREPDERQLEVGPRGARRDPARGSEIGSRPRRQVPARGRYWPQ